MSVTVKICGISTPEAIAAAAGGGAAMLGFVFFPKSPRNVSLEQAAALLPLVPAGIVKVALLVGPDDALALAVTRLGFDLMQLHGGETPERVVEIKALTGLPVMKAVGIRGPEDVARAHAFEAVADYVLLDAKAPEGARLPGGNAVSFDWNLIRGETWERPWLLAGGLGADNLADAVRASGATFVDVSSGVEDAPGHKSPEKIREFLALAKTL
ncbi:MAG: phosphoribosylanthranilate isomerase [Alphaproteobacteria bacterium]|nr:phosphoribosylanthranilate isomerase [Alphaproteobacteria bacterium]MBF0250628.1 phosphoribosylanthranilate isomerase [Alphaproteobacteria bacterium]